MTFGSWFAYSVATAHVAAAAYTFTIPSKVNAEGLWSAPLEPAPVGLSFEFFEFPSYFQNITATQQCLSNFKDLTGTWPPIRIGGTTQDRAVYDASTSAYVVYSVKDARDAPKALTFGPNFIKLAATYAGNVTLGLNRGKNNMNNTIAAGKVAVREMANLYAIELGNEPEYWAGVQPIASGNWGPIPDAKSQESWSIAVSDAIGRKSIVQAGNSNVPPPQWGAQELIRNTDPKVRDYVQTYSHHNYPGGTVASLMSHSNIASNIYQYNADIASALAVNKPYVFGETNSVAGGGAASVSPSFGAALWVMDYSVRSAVSNVSRNYFHQGTIGNSPYSFFGSSVIGTPYIGAYVATAFMAGAEHIAALDNGTSAFAAYVTFDALGAPLRALLYNSNYYTGSGNRSSESLVLTGGFTTTSVRSKRLTAASALARQDRGGSSLFGEQYFKNGTCEMGGTETFETTPVSGGQAVFNVAASEALLVYLQ
ncbi:glycoside hydrolase family 79 protein [Colletotrichum zoysiae]|uniref:Glycoside hydrolase family 79 protein n=1 Tax=Colletotrichum zoysiae TaxID=1216348 RepID=A0AAD9M7W2_9PEZI|nr:glycoside hydrolase family 79 protein [Colletotrichum zoysiae]